MSALALSIYLVGLQIPGIEGSTDDRLDHWIRNKQASLETPPL